MLYPTPDWLIVAYPLWATYWVDSLWTQDQLETFNRCPVDIWRTG